MVFQIKNIKGKFQLFPTFLQLSLEKNNKNSAPHPNLNIITKVSMNIGFYGRGEVKILKISELLS
jgi:hypothetical protein